MSKQGFNKLRRQPEKLTTQNLPQLQTRPFAPTVSRVADNHNLASSYKSTNFKFDQLSTQETAASLPLADSPIQAKLTIGKPGDKYEQEADQVASQVVQQINNPHPLQQKDDIQRSTAAHSLMRLPIQRQTTPPVGPTSDEFESNLNHARSGGVSLAPKVQTQMGNAMGANFSGVKIHTDTQADYLSRSIQAKAFTTGRDVFFKQGEYNPNSRSGQELLAHELTHVVQQSGERSLASRSLIQPNRERSDGLTEAPDYVTEKVAKLHMHADLDAPDMNILKQLVSGEVGHAWVSLEWNDEDNVPGHIPEAHRKQLETGIDPFGFWPKKFDWNDYSSLTEKEIFTRLQEDNSDAYAELEYELKQEHPDWTDKQIEDAIVEAIENDTDFAQAWGGFHTDSDDFVGYSQNPFDSYVPGQVLHPDNQHDAKATQTYDLTQLEVDKVLHYAEAKKTADYSVFFYNCTTFAKEAVQAAGKSAPNAGGKVCYPDKLYKSIKKNFQKGKGTTSLEIGDDMVKKIGTPLTEESKKKKT